MYQNSKTIITKVEAASVPVQKKKKLECGCACKTCSIEETVAVF
jgi:hypothetical protein